MGSRYVARIAKASGGMTADRRPARRGIAPFAYVPDRERRDGFPQAVVRREHSVIVMPVIAWRGHEICELIKDHKRCEFDDDTRSRPRGLPPTPVPTQLAAQMVVQCRGENVADAGGQAICTAISSSPA